MKASKFIVLSFYLNSKYFMVFNVERNFAVFVVRSSKSDYYLKDRIEDVSVEYESISHAEA